jgi:predicted DNA-binding protein
MPINHNYFLSVRLNPEEQEKLQRICEASGLSASRVVRKWITGTEIQPRHPEGLKELYLAVNRIGTNINQIARAVNAGLATKNDMEELKIQMQKVEELLSEVAR